MATPHVAGLIAYLIRLQGNISPAAMSTKLKTLTQGSLDRDSSVTFVIFFQFVPLMNCFSFGYFERPGAQRLGRGTQC